MMVLLKGLLASNLKLSTSTFISINANRYPPVRNSPTSIITGSLESVLLRSYRSPLADRKSEAITNFAIQRLEANRIEIRCDARNVRRARVAERLGFHWKVFFEKMRVIRM